MNFQKKEKISTTELFLPAHSVQSDGKASSNEWINRNLLEDCILPTACYTDKITGDIIVRIVDPFGIRQKSKFPLPCATKKFSQSKQIKNILEKNVTKKFANASNSDETSSEVENEKRIQRKTGGTEDNENQKELQNLEDSDDRNREEKTSKINSQIRISESEGEREQSLTSRRNDFVCFSPHKGNENVDHRAEESQIITQDGQNLSPDDGKNIPPDPVATISIETFGKSKRDIEHIIFLELEKVIGLYKIEQPEAKAETITNISDKNSIEVKYHEKHKVINIPKRFLSIRNFLKVYDHILEKLVKVE